MLRVQLDGLVRRQSEVRGVRAQTPTHVHVAEEPFVLLLLERVEELRPDPRVARGLVDGYATREASLAERRAYPDGRTLHQHLPATG